jgi:hypothetical protein
MSENVEKEQCLQCGKIADAHGASCSECHVTCHHMQVMSEKLPAFEQRSNGRLAG